MTKMYILILCLIQAQPARIPKLVWGGAILVLLIGISLLVYFFSRLRKGEKEPEEDWSLSRRSLFVEPSRSGEGDSAESGSQPEPQAAEHEQAASPVGSVPAPPASDEQKELAPTLIMEAPEPIAPEPPTLEREPAEQTLDREPPVEERETELLVSNQGEEAPAEVEVFADDVWAELDHTAAEVTTEEPRVARLEQKMGREPFEPPGIRPLVGREPFDPPRIDQIVPGGKQGPEVHREASVPAEQTQPQSSFLSEPVAEPSAVSPAVRGTTGASAQRKPAGSVLGLPVESSQGPLILGESSRPRAEAGIGALSNYGKETGPEAGRGGTIALLLTIALVGGGILAYLYVPYVHAKVDSIVARLRGPAQTAETPAPAASGPRAQIFPARSEAVKNVVKARGTIYNTSSKPLEGLSVEVALERGGDVPPDTRTYPVVPSRLEPRQQGRYEFEYDGSQSAGYPSGYRVTKLLSSEGEIKFAAAGQPKAQ